MTVFYHPFPKEYWFRWLWLWKSESNREGPAYFWSKKHPRLDSLKMIRIVPYYLCHFFLKAAYLIIKREYSTWNFSRRGKWKLDSAWLFLAILSYPSRGTELWTAWLEGGQSCWENSQGVGVECKEGTWILCHQKNLPQTIRDMFSNLPLGTS